MTACPGEARGLAPHDAVHVAARLEVPWDPALPVRVEVVHRCETFGCPMRLEERAEPARNPEAVLRKLLEPRGMIAPGKPEPFAYTNLRGPLRPFKDDDVLRDARQRLDEKAAAAGRVVIDVKLEGTDAADFRLVAITAGPGDTFRVPIGTCRKHGCIATLPANWTPNGEVMAVLDHARACQDGRAGIVVRRDDFKASMDDVRDAPRPAAGQVTADPDDFLKRFQSTRKAQRRSP